MKKAKNCIIICCVILNTAADIFADTALNNMKEIKMSDTTITVEPQVEYFVPNGVVSVAFNQMILKTAVSYKSKYDFPNNSVYSDFDFCYLINPYGIGVNLSDHIDFERMFSSQKTLVRARHIKPYLDYYLTDTTKLTAATRFQNTYAVTVDNTTTLDNGANVILSLGVLNSTLDRSKEAPTGGSISFEVSKSVSRLSGDYDYTSADLNILSILHPYSNHFVEATLKVGYPVSIIKKPIVEIYSLGGYEMMKGYALREFEGNNMVYSQLKYRVPLVKTPYMNLRKVELSLLSWDFIIEAGSAGETEVFETFKSLKKDFGSGFGCEMLFFKKLHTKFEFSVASPFDTFTPKSYFSITAVSYFKPADNRKQ